MKKRSFFLIGEAERGDFCTPLACSSLQQLSDTLGNPPEESRALAYAVQSLLYQRTLIFFRVQEEGYSTDDYLRALNLLKKQDFSTHVGAICMPGVGEKKLIEAYSELCTHCQMILIIDDKDLYDYLTHH